jgi:SAM-dependent methyltransferase
VHNYLKGSRMDPVFGRAYAEDYDLLYQDKCYESECDTGEKVSRRFHDGPVSSILDLGCGTGNHALPLARRGYRVVGVDRAPDMLARAHTKAAKCAERGNVPEFVEADVRTLDLGERFDMALMMFAVLGYQLANDDVLAAFSAVHRHLHPDGLFVFDFWYGPAVLAVRPGDRVRVVPAEGGRLIRAASATLDTTRQICEVCYRLWHLEGDRLLHETEERHHMRYFFAQELSLFAQCSGLELVGLYDLRSLERPATEDSWNALAVARVSKRAL